MSLQKRAQGSRTPRAKPARSFARVEVTCNLNQSVSLFKLSTYPLRVITTAMCQSTTCSTCLKSSQNIQSISSESHLFSVAHNCTTKHIFNFTYADNHPQKVKPGWVAARTSHQSSTPFPRASGARADRRSRGVGSCILLVVSSLRSSRGVILDTEIVSFWLTCVVLLIGSFGGMIMNMFGWGGKKGGDGKEEL